MISGRGMSVSSVHDLYVGFDGHLGVAEAGAAAAHRGGVAVVEADGDPEGIAAGRDAVGWIEAHPVEPGNPGLRPGMAGTADMQLGVVVAQVAADIARRHAETAAAADEDVRRVLCDAGNAITKDATLGGFCCGEKLLAGDLSRE